MREYDVESYVDFNIQYNRKTKKYSFKIQVELEKEIDLIDSHFKVDDDNKWNEIKEYSQWYLDEFNTTTTEELDNMLCIHNMKKLLNVCVESYPRWYSLRKEADNIFELPNNNNII